MILGLLVFAAHAGLSMESVSYNGEGWAWAPLDDPFLPELAIFSGWVEDGRLLRGFSDGALLWMVEGWEPYGYQQAVYPHTVRGDIDAWGWSSLASGDPNPELVSVSLECLVGSSGTLTWDDFSILRASPTLVAQGDDGEAESLSLDRVFIDRDGRFLTVSCEGIGRDVGTPITITLSWLRSRS